MVKIEFEEGYDLFRKGNYINSFTTLEQVSEYLQSIAEQTYASESHKINLLNNRVYTILKSKHVKFS